MMIIEENRTKKNNSDKLCFIFHFFLNFFHVVLFQILVIIQVISIFLAVKVGFQMKKDAKKMTN